MSLEHELPPQSEPLLRGTPRAALFVTAYHLLVLLAAAVLLLGASQPTCPLAAFKLPLYCASFAAIGGTLNASRYVIKAVRYSEYDPRRFLWQLLTPVHAPFLGLVGYAALNGGLVSLTTGPKADTGYTYFIMAMGFLIGMSSELFIKRLIRASESLFGEATQNIEDVDHRPPPSPRNSDPDDP